MAFEISHIFVPLEYSNQYIMLCNNNLTIKLYLEDQDAAHTLGTYNYHQFIELNIMNYHKLEMNSPST